MRACWKLEAVDQEFCRNSYFLKFTNKGVIRLWAKGTRIFSDLLGRNIQIYNGVKFVDLPIRNEMWGLVLGHFILTKRITSTIHNKTRRNKRGRRKKKK